MWPRTVVWHERLGNRDRIGQARPVGRSCSGTRLLAVALTLTGGWTLAGCASLQRASQPTVVRVDVADQHQTIAGFGASSAYTCPAMTDAEADLFFTPEHGLGLSLLRMYISPAGVCSEFATGRQAIKRGARVWAAPWTPPAEWKDNHDLEHGGHLLPEHRQDWADRLASVARQAADAGVPLYAISAQNEPGYVPDPPNSWETCDYTPATLAAFVGEYLGPALKRQGLSTRVLAPEADGWGKFDGFADALLANPAAAACVGPLAVHSYNGTAHISGRVQSSGHEVWETEYADLSDVKDPGMESALKVARQIHADLVDGDVSGWHFWQFVGTPPYAHCALIYEGALTRRAWALANWSRFVRPGFVRVEATEHPEDGVLASAFIEPNSGRLVIVFVNSTNREVQQPLTVLHGATPEHWQAWATSAALALQRIDAIAPVSGGLFRATLPARSVVTLVSTR